ncbi:MAG: DNA mismatch repair endonuclease MutL [Planctomycetaceae bacterium]
MSATTDQAPRIQQLSDSVINKIAAGEVIERPASVIKELLENSIDALATHIEIEIQRGGADLIRIVDDGEGIHPDDLPLAIAPHATSKLRSADDLFHVRSMGFRGEALASIAEISKLRIRSRQPDSDLGSELVVDGGEAQPVVPCGCPVGTSIEVRELFYTTPVRRKFLKNPSTEFGHISEQFTRIALANPNLHLALKHNDRTVYELPATQRLLERLELFYGGELAKDLIPIEMHRDGNRVWGFVGHPKQSRTTRKHQYLFLNGRWIQDRSLQHAVNEAYRGLLMVGRQPVAFLFLEASPESFDVNVHPTKSEVRFLDSSALFRLILSAIRSKFLGMDLGGVLNTDRLIPSGGKKGDARQHSRTGSGSRSALRRAGVDLSCRSPAPAGGRGRAVELGPVPAGRLETRGGPPCARASRTLPCGRTPIPVLRGLGRTRARVSLDRYLPRCEPRSGAVIHSACQSLAPQSLAIRFCLESSRRSAHSPVVPSHRQPGSLISSSADSHSHRQSHRTALHQRSWGCAGDAGPRLLSGR